MVKEFEVVTKKKSEFIDILSRVQSSVREMGVKDGICLVCVPHTTAAVTINENADPSVVHDILMESEKIVPWRDMEYRHAEGNSAAHIKSSFFGASELFMVENGRIVMGTWQTIYFCEFDGPRRRRVLVKALNG